MPASITYPSPRLPGYQYRKPPGWGQIGPQLPTQPPVFEYPVYPQRPAPAARPARQPAYQPRQTYRPRSYYSRSRGGGGGGGGMADRYGIPSPWLSAYRGFWGRGPGQPVMRMYDPVTSLFARMAGRMPTIADWTSIWNKQKADREWLMFPKYEAAISSLIRPPLFTPPSITYSPALGF